MNAASLNSSNCYSRNAMLAQPVLHQFAKDENKSANADSAAPVAQKTGRPHQHTTKDLLQRKMELHEQATSGSSSSSKTKDKMVQIWQHIISQSSAPAAKRGGGGLMRR